MGWLGGSKWYLLGFKHSFSSGYLFQYSEECCKILKTIKILLYWIKFSKDQVSKLRPHSIGSNLHVTYDDKSMLWNNDFSEVTEILSRDYFYFASVTNINIISHHHHIGTDKSRMSPWHYILKHFIL